MTAYAGRRWCNKCCRWELDAKYWQPLEHPHRPSKKWRKRLKQGLCLRQQAAALLKRADKLDRQDWLGDWHPDDARRHLAAEAAATAAEIADKGARS